MKHGRRHKVLKEKTYRDRAAQDAPGYKRPYDPIDVREPEHPSPPPAPPTTPAGSKIGGKAKRDLQRLGIDPNEP